MKKRSDEKPTKWDEKESSSEWFADFNSGSHSCFYGPWTGYLVFLFKKQLQGSERFADSPKHAVRCPKLSRRPARYHLTMALFPSPLSERSVTVSVSLRSPVVHPVAQRRQVTFSAILALRISPTA